MKKVKEHYLYNTYITMKYRCDKKGSMKYKYYGGRGISYDHSWKDDFWKFTEDIFEAIGLRPEGHTLDRIDNDGNYVVGNLRWATHSQQSRNTRRHKKHLTTTTDIE